MIGQTGSNHPEKYQLKTNHFFSYRKHNAIYFQVNVQRRQTAFHAEQRALLINIPQPRHHFKRCARIEFYKLLALYHARS